MPKFDDTTIYGDLTVNGTIRGSYAKGDILYASDANTLTRLPKGSDGQVLKLASGIPAWGTDNNTNTTYTAGTNVSINSSNVISATDTIYTHPNITRSDTSETVSPGYSGTFTAVDSITSNAQGHISAINLKTVTMPSAQTLPTVNNSTITIAAGSGLSTGGNFTLNQSGAKTITLNHSNSITAGNAGDPGSNRTLAYSGSFVVPYIGYNATGHITSVSNRTIFLPAATYPTITNLSSGEMYLLGMDSSSTTSGSTLYRNTDLKLSSASVMTFPSSGSIMFPSDRRVKNLKKKMELNNILDRITEVDIWDYVYKSSPEIPQIGIVAQDIQEKFPEIADVIVSKTENGEVEDQLVIKENKLIYLLWSALQEEIKERKNLEVLVRELIDK